MHGISAKVIARKQRYRLFDGASPVTVKYPPTTRTNNASKSTALLIFLNRRLLLTQPCQTSILPRSSHQQKRVPTFPEDNATLSWWLWWNLCWLPLYCFTWKLSSSKKRIQLLLLVSASAAHLCTSLQVTLQLLLVPGNQTLAFSVLQAFSIFFMPKLAPWLFPKAARLHLEEEEGKLCAFFTLCKPRSHTSADDKTLTCAKTYWSSEAAWDPQENNTAPSTK